MLAEPLGSAEPRLKITALDLDQSLVELWSNYRLSRSGLALAQRKSKSKG